MVWPAGPAPWPAAGGCRDRGCPGRPPWGGLVAGLSPQIGQVLEHHPGLVSCLLSGSKPLAAMRRTKLRWASTAWAGSTRIESSKNRRAPLTSHCSATASKSPSGTSFQRMVSTGPRTRSPSRPTRTGVQSDKNCSCSAEKALPGSASPRPTFGTWSWSATREAATTCRSPTQSPSTLNSQPSCLRACSHRGVNRVRSNGRSLTVESSLPPLFWRKRRMIPLSSSGKAADPPAAATSSRSRSFAGARRRRTAQVLAWPVGPARRRSSP